MENENTLQPTQTETLQDNSGYLKNLVSATNLQNALQEKANCNSRELMEDVHRMRSLADEAYYAH